MNVRVAWLLVGLGAFGHALDAVAQTRTGREVYQFAVSNYTGITYEFWRSCDAVGDRTSWQIWGLPNCGKGDPMQTMRVAHGAPAARFRNVEMG